jgi:hypothetical protein
VEADQDKAAPVKEADNLVLAEAREARLGFAQVGGNLDKAVATLVVAGKEEQGRAAEVKADAAEGNS